MVDKPTVKRTILSSNASSRKGLAIDHVVMHYTTSRNIEGTLKHFESGSPRVSAHYVIGQDGELVQTVADDKAAWHSGSSTMNARSIGIEHSAAPGDKITPAQEATSAALLKWLVATYDIPTAKIIPHVAVKSTSCPGDLFADYGGKAGADAATQKAALQRWLSERVFPEKAAQTRLAELGYPVGLIDGDVGSRTRMVARTYQETVGLPVTGALDADTLASLRSPDAPRMPVSEARAKATAADVAAAGSTTIKAANKLETVAAIGTGGTIGNALVEAGAAVTEAGKVVATVDTGRKVGTQSWDLLAWVMTPKGATVTLSVGVCVLLWIGIRYIKARRIAAHRAGRQV